MSNELLKIFYVLYILDIHENKLLTEFIRRFLNGFYIFFMYYIYYIY